MAAASCPRTGFGSVDMNILPESLVKRVDTVTGGASAAYGTDAVAGVVNFILDTEYTGWQSHAQSGATSRSDHDNPDIRPLTAGHLASAPTCCSTPSITSPTACSVTTTATGTRAGARSQPCQHRPRDCCRPNVVSAASTFGGLINGGVPTTPRCLAGSSCRMARSHLSCWAKARSPRRLALDHQRRQRRLHRRRHEHHRTGCQARQRIPVPGLRRDAQPEPVRAGPRGPEHDRPAGSRRPIRGRRRASTPRITIFRENAFLPAAVRQIMVNENLTSFQMNVAGDREGLGPREPPETGQPHLLGHRRLQVDDRS